MNESVRKGGRITKESNITFGTVYFIDCFLWMGIMDVDAGMQAEGGALFGQYNSKNLIRHGAAYYRCVYSNLHHFNAPDLGFAMSDIGEPEPGGVGVCAGHCQWRVNRICVASFRYFQPNGRGCGYKLKDFMGYVRMTTL